MARITNPETLATQQEIRLHIAMTIATLKAMDAAVRRDYRSSVVNLSTEARAQAMRLVEMADTYKGKPRGDV